MYRIFNNLNDKTTETYQAYVDIIIPRSPELAEEYGSIQYFGALDLHTDEYLIMSLNHYDIPLAEPIADLLNLAAEQLSAFNENDGRLQPTGPPEEAAFAALRPGDRFRALELLGRNADYFVALIEPLQNRSGVLLSAVNILNRFTMMGYYSEWSGYGSTRLDAPDQRRLEFFPISWEQVGYPGPSLGYRGQRT